MTLLATRRKTASGPSLMCLALLMAVQTSTADDDARLANLEKCRAIDSAGDRLLCYDTVVDGGEFGDEQLEQAKVERFGDSAAASVNARNQDEQIAVTVVRVSKGETGTHYFYTANDQVWAQTGRGNWALDVPFEATIESGAMGSYFLRTAGGKSARVKRVR